MQSSDAVIRLLKAAVMDTHAKESPHSLSCRLVEYGFKNLGCGLYSAVFEHPFRDDVVLKVGTSNTDGWLKFAVYSMLHPSPLFMRVHNLHMFDGFYIAELERLSPNTEGYSRESRELQHPDVDRIQDVLGYFTDLHRGNIMLRDGKPVITDPYIGVWRDKQGVYSADTYREHTSSKVAVSVERYEQERSRRARVAEDSKVTATEQAAKDNALRLYAEPIRESNFKRMDRVLPQMRGDILSIKRLATFAGGLKERTGLYPFQAYFAGGFQPNVQRRDDYKRFSVNLVSKGVDNKPAPHFIQNRFFGEVQAGGLAGVRPDRIIRDSIAPEAIPRRPRTKILHIHIFGRDVRIPIKSNEHREALLEAWRDIVKHRERWPGAPNHILACHYRRYIECYPGRDIHPDWIAAWNRTWGREIGPLTGPRCQHYYAGWDMAGPGQGGETGNNELREEADANGRRALSYREQEGPKVALG